MMVPEFVIVPELVNVLPAKFVMVPELLMPVPPVFDTVISPELVMMPKEMLTMPLPPEFTVIVPELEMPMVVPELLLFWMPTVPAGFDIVIVPPA